MKSQFNLEKILSRVKNFFKPSKMPTLIFLLAVLLVLYLLYINFLKEGFESKPAELDEQIASGKKVVLFYADWCGHCKKIKPVWDEAAKEVNKDEKKMIKVNCGEGTKEEKAIMDKYDIDGYPTIIIFQDGKPSKYEGNRNKEDFLGLF